MSLGGLNGISSWLETLLLSVVLILEKLHLTQKICLSSKLTHTKGSSLYPHDVKTSPSGPWWVERNIELVGHPLEDLVHGDAVRPQEQVELGTKSVDDQ